MKKFFWFSLVVILVVLGGIFAYRNANPPSINRGNDRFTTPSIIEATSTQAQAMVDLNDGDSYTFTLQSKKQTIAGREIDALTYNGIVPGPTIRVQQGSIVRLTLKNDLDRATTLHPHGVRVENASDGVPDVTQKAIKPGESFTYTLRFPDAGVFWYHPHIDEVMQQNLGLYGNFLVVPTSTSYLSPVNREEILVLQDMLFNGKKPAPFNDGRSSYYGMMGRYGNVLLINGKTDYRLETKKGEVVRFFITNAANARPFRLAIPGAKMKLIGGDNGKYEQEIFVDNIIISPSERAIVEVLFDTPGELNIANDTPIRVSTMGTVHVSNDSVGTSYVEAFNQRRTNQDVKASIDPLRQLFSKQPDKTLDLGFNMMGNGGMMGGNGMMGHGMMGSGGMMGSSSDSSDGIEWEDQMGSMSAQMTAVTAGWMITDKETGKTNDKINWSFKQGAYVKIRINNPNTGMHPMQHPFHVHGQRFLVLSENGKANANMVWKDTALLPAGTTIDILIEMSNPGQWMMHCHIAEHLESGMMLNYEVK